MRPARFRPRLLPVLIAGGAGLLALKLIGLWSQGGYLLIDPDLKKSSHANFARAITQARTNPDFEPDVTGSVPPKPDKKDAKEEPQKLSPGDAKKQEQVLPAKPLPPPLPSPAERQLLEKLGERRQQLDDRLKELELRELMLQSAEKMLQEKLGELKESETRAATGTQAKSQGEQSQMRALVVMYEAMKPREAAKVFERMEPKVLMTLAQQMNPRKLSEVLAQMTPDTAEKLTSALIRKAPVSADGAAPGEAATSRPPAMEELPRLDLKNTPKG